MEKTRVLLVDDDERLLNAAKRVLRKDIDLETAAGAQPALTALKEKGPFAVIISDQNMPDMKGTALLAEVARQWPLTVRIMLTGNNDQQTAISAVNDGQIFRFINKPCEPEDLMAAISSAHQHHRLLSSEKTLLEKTLSGSVKVLTDVLALSKPDAFNRSSDIHRWARKLMQRLGLDRPWEVDLAAMLSSLGYVALPDAVVKKYFSGAQLQESERELIAQASANGRNLIRNIPRMDHIAEAIYYSRKGYDGSGFPKDKVKGGEIPPIARLLKTLIDLAEIVAPGNVSFDDAVTQLERRKHQHDPEVLRAVEDILYDDMAFRAAGDKERLQLPPSRLADGDVVATDIVDKYGIRLLAAGSTLSSLTIKRLRSIQEENMLPHPVDIWRARLSPAAGSRRTGAPGIPPDGRTSQQSGRIVANA